MTIVVNGEERAFFEPLTLEQLIEKLGLATAACDSELNRRLVPKKSRSDAHLKEGDVVEVVTMVGGG